MPGVTITNGISTATPVVLAATHPGRGRAVPVDARRRHRATGKIVVCQRGTNGRIDKGRKVAAGGAAGMILYNAIKQDVETDNHCLPAIHVDGPATALLAFFNGHTGVKATWATGVAVADHADVMATFSSRGPVGDFLKPDVTAPGHPGARRHDADARPDDRRQRAAGQNLPWRSRAPRCRARTRPASRRS